MTPSHFDDGVLRGLILERSMGEPMSGCWLWLAGRYPNGYGALRAYGRTRQAHRVSHQVFNGPLSDGQCVMHRCDLRPCVNPAHLVAGTARDNMQDAQRKGRLSTGDRHWTRQYPGRMKGVDLLAHVPERRARGERHPRAALTAEQVAIIRATYAAGGTTYTVLAATYRVAISTIWNIVRGHTWSHACP